MSASRSGLAFHPVAAGGTAPLITILHALTHEFSSHPIMILTTMAAAAYAAPAGLSESLVESGLTKGVLHPDYPLYWAIITQNALYAFAAVLAGSLSP